MLTTLDIENLLQPEKDIFTGMFSLSLSDLLDLKEKSDNFNLTLVKKNLIKLKVDNFVFEENTLVSIGEKEYLTHAFIDEFNDVKIFLSLVSQPLNVV